MMLRWCSSSRNRPDSTRASYSAMGPWVRSGSSVASVRISTHVEKQSFQLRNVHSRAACAYPLQPTGAKETLFGTWATLLGRAGACPGACLACLELLVQLVHITLLPSTVRLRPTAILFGVGPAHRERVLNPLRASDDVIFDIRRTA